MKRFIYRVRGDGLYILDIRETDDRIKTAARFLSQYEAPKILVVTSRQYGQYPARKFAETIGGIAATGRFIPGKLTNQNLNGYMEPEVVVVTDPIGDSQAIKEAVQCGIPIVALCDTNNMTSYIDLVIPTNNKGRKALSMIYYLLTREMLTTPRYYHVSHRRGLRDRTLNIRSKRGISDEDSHLRSRRNVLSEGSPSSRAAAGEVVRRQGDRPVMQRGLSPPMPGIRTPERLQPVAYGAIPRLFSGTFHRHRAQPPGLSDLYLADPVGDTSRNR